MSGLEFAQWLETTRVGELVTLSQWGFPILVAIHLMGLGFSVGTILWMDLRLLGLVMQSVPARDLYKRLAPIIAVGFLAMFVSGAMLLTGYASAAYVNTFFRIKVVALLVAGINAVVYHVITERRLATWPASTMPPLAVRATGIISITAWLIVILCGRAMSYTMF